MVEYYDIDYISCNIDCITRKRKGLFALKADAVISYSRIKILSGRGMLPGKGYIYHCNDVSCRPDSGSGIMCSILAIHEEGHIGT